MINLLIVEDEATLSDNIKEILSDLGEITQIYDGEEGLFEAETGVYDLILLDLMLPGKNGYEILAELRKKKYPNPCADSNCQRWPRRQNHWISKRCRRLFDETFLSRRTDYAGQSVIEAFVRIVF